MLILRPLKSFIFLPIVLCQLSYRIRFSILILISPFQLQILILDAVNSKLSSWIYTQFLLPILNIYFVLHNNSINGSILDVLLNSKILMLDGNNLRNI
ncbi:hypothetical protein Ahy_A09g045999 [Arachis hypogaea]|uniref:Uncharacterized protein n=1 Tax=Arachis hypogaea TaxID=3818 RepID=A0A445BNN9_ARAHY|nr:hypothetical protein Ahy_A09g045999 [Arachis hypogaea]